MTLCRAFGFDDNVLQLNLKRLRENRLAHHTPYPVAKLIRQIGCRPRKMVIGTKVELLLVWEHDLIIC